MKVAILAGGAGTRLNGETDAGPKPLVEIGGRPILWHILMHYAHHGFADFLIALGHRAQAIRDYIGDGATFATGVVAAAGASEGMATRGTTNGRCALQLVDTGLHTQTGGRLKRLAPLLDDTFMLTWSDGLSDVDLRALLAFHRAHGRLATVTAVRPPPRFGRLTLDGDRVVAFAEKPPVTDVWINGAFFVLEPQVLDYIEGDATEWEREPMERLARDGQLMAYRHGSFWQCLDTPRDRAVLQQLWESGAPPWKVWP